jgi:hypothetical protein
MSQWMKERDLLVAETLDLLKGIATKSKPATATEQVASAKNETSKPVVASVPIFDRSEVKARLARFEATQLKFQREREQYYVETMAKARATQWQPR